MQLVAVLEQEPGVAGVGGFERAGLRADWDASRVELSGSGPSAPLRIAADAPPVVLQLSRWRRAGRPSVWLRLRGISPAPLEELHLEVRSASGARVVLVAALEAGTSVEGLPWLAARGGVAVEQDELLALLEAARAHGARLASWQGMDPGAAPRLAGERTLSLQARAVVMLSDPVLIVGMLLFAVLLPIGAAIGWDADWQGPFLEPDARAVGQVIELEETSTSINDEDVVGYRVRFADASGAPHETTSYMEGVEHAVGDWLHVEYESRRPERARVVGYRSGASPFGLGVGMAALPALALVVMLVGVVRGGRRAGLLRRGALTQATLVAKHQTPTTINDDSVYEMVFGFHTPDGQVHHASVLTHRVQLLEDEPRERILYDPRKPSRALAVDLLPEELHLDEEGRVGVERVGAGYLIGPVLVVVEVGVLAVLLLT